VTGEEHPHEIDWDDLADFIGVERDGELGDKLAVALALQPARGDTFHISGRSRPWWRQLWLRLLPGKHCGYCGSRLSRKDPDGQPSRVWWCPNDHGPWEQPDQVGWGMEVRTWTTPLSGRRLP